ncbi:hypothetical protein FKN01_31300 [Streptomyces sp. 130]|uniref:hypothetical protein n=1 Tax=Streptomyces sp. 130 TaxID=2591006 RepID=UPI00117F3469|nr:hypothetical protein [Streptomyces sp. 130]TRV71772.1 hypothetical protein FKN01_31300 [Streptomyces sp. 130]
MHTGDAGDLRRAERQAAELAAEVADLLTQIERTTGEGSVRGTITGPGFEVRRIGSRWTVRT